MPRHLEALAGVGDPGAVDFQDREILLETDATLSQSSPLVIKGPQIGSGQLLLLLVVQ